jgi:hypothetical protein
MRSSRVVRASGCQCQSSNSPGCDPSILRHSGIWGAADEAVLNTVQKMKNKKTPPSKNVLDQILGRPISILQSCFHFFPESL